MNLKRLIPTIVIVFVLAHLSGFLIHALVLGPDYERIAQHYRAAGTEKMLFLFLAYLSFAIGSVLIYARGVENKAWLGQGIRFGILIWLVLTIPSFFIEYAVQPIPTGLMVKQVVYEGVSKVLLGVVTAVLYRPPMK